MEKKVYSTDGKELRTITLDDKVFGLPVNDDVIYYAITNELANMRVGTACTKGRAEVQTQSRISRRELVMPAVVIKNHLLWLAAVRFLDQNHVISAIQCLKRQKDLL